MATYAEQRGFAPALKNGVREPLTLKTLFGQDYWPTGGRPPAWRLALSLALSPLAVLLPTLLFALLVYQVSESDGAEAWLLTQEAGVEFFSALYLPLLISSAIGGAALWALRLRSRRAFAAAGAVLGAINAALVLAIYGALHEVVALYAVFAGALAMLALRWLAEIRKLA